MSSGSLSRRDFERMRASSLLVSVFLTAAPLVAFALAGSLSVSRDGGETVFEAFDFADSPLAYVAFGGLALTLAAGVWVARWLLLRAVARNVAAD